MKNKRLMCIMLAVALIVTTIAGIGITALATEPSYTYDMDTATLTITGNGELASYSETTLKSRPWHIYKDETKHIVVSNGITSIGDYALSQFKYVQDVELPSTLTTIGTAAFSGFNSLYELTVPDSVVTIGDYAFGFDDEMNIIKGFVANCSTKSVAQDYCYRNLIPFNTPMDDMRATAHITTGGELQKWSFVPKADGVLTFYSISTKDTFGFLFDASDYYYSTSFKENKSIAKAYNDDYGSDSNFRIVYNVTAGNRYYLCARFSTSSVYDGSSANQDGRFGVAIKFECNNHQYTSKITTQPTCVNEGIRTYACVGCTNSYTEKIAPLGHSFTPIGVTDDAVALGCIRCNEKSECSFMAGYHNDIDDSNKMLDVNSDGIINAKDYAIIKDRC